MTWWEAWFGEEYLDLYPHRDLESARREAAFALRHLPPQPAPLLDLCCGSGRHSLPLAEAGLPPVGLDYSAPLLDLARRRNPRLSLVRGDMRSLPFLNRCFRSVLSFFTSFGYFRAEAENVAVVAEVARVLEEGGAFLCDTFHRDYALERLVEEERRRCGDREYRIRRWWNAESRRIEKEIEVRREGTLRLFRESVRAYTCDELVTLLQDAGLCVEETWGGFDEAPVGPGSPRLITLARKPGTPS